MTVTQDLITLKAQYEQSLETASAKAGHYQAQLIHINALLLDQLIRPTNGFIPITFSQPLPPAAKVSPAPAAESIAAVTVNTTVQQPDKIKGRVSLVKPSEGRISLPLVSVYQGMKKQDAIAKLLETESGNILSMDTIIHRLYGELSPQTLKAERVRMKSALYQGSKQNFWQKAPQPYSYFLKPSKSKVVLAPTLVTSTPVTPTSGKLNSVSSAVQSSKKGVSQRSSAPGIIKLPTQQATPTKRKSKKAVSVKAAPKDQKPQTQILSLQSKSLGARIILPMHEDFAGLSKIDAVLKVMKERVGKPVHIEDIMDRLFGTLSPEETKVEKGRMKDVMNRGRERALWAKAPVPMSFIVGKGK